MNTYNMDSMDTALDTLTRSLPAFILIRIAQDYAPCLNVWHIGLDSLYGFSKLSVALDSFAADAEAVT